MKKLCLLIAGIGILSITTFAQEGTKPKPATPKKTEQPGTPKRKLTAVKKPMKQKAVKHVPKAKLAEAKAK